MHTLLYVPYILFFLYLVIEFGSRIAWIHTPHFTTVKTSLLVSGTLTSIMTVLFGTVTTPDGTTFINDGRYELVIWTTIAYFSLITLVYVFEWIKDHKIALLIERSYFRRGYEYAEAHARAIVASPFMILLAFLGLGFLLCSIVLTYHIFGA